MHNDAVKMAGILEDLTVLIQIAFKFHELIVQQSCRQQIFPSSFKWHINPSINPLIVWSDKKCSMPFSKAQGYSFKLVDLKHRYSITITQN